MSVRRVGPRGVGGAQGQMKTWDLTAIDVRPHHPEVVCSNADGRAIVIDLPAGERLDEHQVYDASWLVVMYGHIEVHGPDGREGTEDRACSCTSRRTSGTRSGRRATRACSCS